MGGEEKVNSNLSTDVYILFAMCTKKYGDSMSYGINTMLGEDM